MRGDNHTVMEQIGVGGSGRAGKADAASRRPLREEDGRQTVRRLSGSGEGGTGAAPRARPPRLGRSAGSTEGDGGEVRADGGFCRHRPAKVGLPPERGQWRPLPGLPGSRHRTPQPCHRERAAKELAGLEARLFPEKAASRERKAAHLRADNRASPTASLKRERKEPPGKRQTGETGRRKPPGRRIRM